MTVKEHYDNHLGAFYSWMIGDFTERQKEQQAILEQLEIKPCNNKIAIDLGAGHGLQAVSLAQSGFKVKAIDFNGQLLAELELNRGDQPVEIINDDLLNVKKYGLPAPEVITCCGDTITHLSTTGELRQLIGDCAEILVPNGKLVLSFRDYTHALSGDSRFIKVKSDDTRILTCCLDYDATSILVTDMLYEKENNNWVQKISSYTKLRILPEEVINMLKENGFVIQANIVINRFVYLVAVKVV